MVQPVHMRVWLCCQVGLDAGGCCYGRVRVRWDNLNTHVSRAMADLIAARDWLTVCQLRPCARELSPVEPVWSHLRRSLASLARHNIAQLTARAKTRLRRMQ